MLKDISESRRIPAYARDALRARFGIRRVRSEALKFRRNEAEAIDVG